MSNTDIEVAHLRHQGHTISSAAQRDALLRQLKQGTLRRRGDEPAPGGQREPDILKWGDTYYWRARTIHNNQLGKATVVDEGGWSKWETFRLERAAPTVQKKDTSARRLTPRLAFELREWSREQALISGLQYEIIPKSAGDFTGERALFIRRSDLRGGWNNFTIQERLA